MRTSGAPGTAAGYGGVLPSLAATVSAVPTPATPARVHRALVCLMVLVVALATHGSLYPWQFAMPPSWSTAWYRMVHQPSLWTSLGDVVGNVALFVPVGALAWALLKRWVGWRRTLVVLAAGTAFAFALQVAQLAVPARDAALSDVVWNALGLLFGMAVVAVGSRLHLPWLGGESLRAPLTVVLLWLLLQWWPMVPRLDWQQIKNALKPLLLAPRWSTFSALEAALSLMVVGCMVRRVPARRSLVLGLAAAAALGTLLMVHQALTPGRVAGWTAGLVGVWLLWRVPPRTAAWTMACAAWAWFTIDELRPFALADTLSTFQWLPFAAMLQGSLAANTMALAWHLFWLGAVVLLATAHGTPAGPLALMLSAWAFGLEALQLLLVGRVADSTPLLLPWLWLLALPLLRPPPPHPGT